MAAKFVYSCPAAQLCVLAWRGEAFHNVQHFVPDVSTSDGGGLGTTYSHGTNMIRKVSEFDGK